MRLLLTVVSIPLQYGSTETCTISLWKSIEPQETCAPVPDQRCLILDPEMRPVPVGAFGEIYVGGARLARGYLNRPELSSEKFVPNPYATEEEKKRGWLRLFKTGAIGRWTNDGEMEFKSLLTEARNYWNKANIGAPNDLRMMLNDAYFESISKTSTGPPTETVVVVEPDIIQRLKLALSSNGIALNVAVNFAFCKLIQVYTSDDETVVGLTICGQAMAGDGLINSLPFNVQWEARLEMIELLKRMQTQLDDIASHSQTPLSEIVKAKGGEKPFSTVLGKSWWRTCYFEFVGQQVFSIH